MVVALHVTRHAAAAVVGTRSHDVKARLPAGSAPTSFMRLHYYFLTLTGSQKMLRRARLTYGRSARGGLPNGWSCWTA